MFGERTLNLANPVNRAAPLNRGRICWLMRPPHNSAKIFDIMRPSRRLSGNSTAGGYVSELRGLSRMSICGSTGVGDEVVADAALKLSHPISLAMTVQFRGTPTSNAGVFGVAFDNADGNPYLSYCFYTPTGTPALSVSAADGSTFRSFETGVTAASITTPERWLGVIHGAGVEIYRNGVNVLTTAVARSSPNYSATSLLFVGDYSGINRNSNCNVSDGTIWNRQLSASDARQDYLAWKLGFRNELNWLDRPWLIGAVAAPSGNRRRRVLLGSH
jgi:hypothetical protein